MCVVVLSAPEISKVERAPITPFYEFAKVGMKSVSSPVVTRADDSETEQLQNMGKANGPLLPRWSINGVDNFQTYHGRETSTQRSKPGAY